MKPATGAAAVIAAEKSVLVLVDYQQRLVPALHRGDAALAEALRLADAARTLGIRVIGTEQNPAGLGPNVAALRERCYVTLAKRHFDACEDGLLDALGSASAGKPGDPLDVVIAGCETHVCLLQTALGLLRRGHAVWVVGPACASRTAVDRELALERLKHAGAVVVSREMVAFEWLHGCAHPRFREMLAQLRQPGDL